MAKTLFCPKINFRSPTLFGHTGSGVVKPYPGLFGNSTPKVPQLCVVAVSQIAVVSGSVGGDLNLWERRSCKLVGAKNAALR